MSGVKEVAQTLPSRRLTSSDTIRPIFDHGAQLRSKGLLVLLREGNQEETLDAQENQTHQYSRRWYRPETLTRGGVTLGVTA